MKKLFGIMALVLLASGVGAFAASGTLDNSVWNATLQDDNSQDTLVFVKGQFVSTKCVPYGFGTSSYSSSDTKEGSQWKTQQMANGHKTSWTGKVNGDTMSGQFMHTEPDGKVTTQMWTATKEK